jgi:hypothetical protein
MYVIALFLLLHAPPESRSGTIIATKFSDERLIIAADSRVSDINGSLANERECKIHVIDKSLVFAGAGKQRIIYDKKTFLDGTDIATRVRHSNSTASVGRVATLWAQQMKFVLGEVGASSREALLKGLKTEIVVRGIFIGVAPKGRIAAYNAAIIYKLIGSKILLTSRVEPLGRGIRVFSRDSAVFQEFLSHDTKRAVDWNTRLEKELDAKNIRDYDPYRLIAGVEATIQWANDETIGGDVDALIMYKGGKIVWLKKKKNCDDGQHHSH